jgi:hypothetical protein
MEPTKQSAEVPLNTNDDDLLLEEDDDLRLQGVDVELWHEVLDVLNDMGSLTLDSILAIIAIRRGSVGQPGMVLEDLLLKRLIEAYRLHDGEWLPLFSIASYRFRTMRP